MGSFSPFVDGHSRSAASRLCIKSLGKKVKYDMALSRMSVVPRMGLRIIHFILCKKNRGTLDLKERCSIRSNFREDFLV